MPRRPRNQWLHAAAVFTAVAAHSPAAAGVELDPISPRLPSADPQRGQTIFLQCKSCHVAEKGGKATIGPNLWGVVGRPVASQPGFRYSDSLEALGGTWTYEMLSRYLFEPANLAPRTRMAFPGIKSARDRADLISHLRTLSDAPFSLPESSSAEASPVFGGLPEGRGREAVYFTCRACHSLDQFERKRLSRDRWDALISEMVAENGMAEPESWVRALLLDYLSAKFGVADNKRWKGLPPGPGREEVFYTCKACHSLMLVKQQGMSRDRWEETLEWMVEEQGMDEIDDPETRNRILDYLATHYGSGTPSR